MSAFGSGVLYVHRYVHICFMKAITVSEFRKNIKKYAEIAQVEKVIVHRGDGNPFAIVPLPSIEDKGYSQDFVNRILKAQKEVEKGNSVVVRNPKDIWADIL